ncbi:MAG: asparagine synthase (glutamine-hydrolyzing) [Janthinobacterium lividum]
MCGIAGFSTKHRSPRLDLLKIMAKSLAHRGPDGEAIEIRDQVGLVHRRLSIIDLATGQQPLIDDAGRLLVVNGEIYNYLELKQGFPEFKFRTQSDCEVILALYARYGLSFTDHLRGMYSLALYDPTTQDLILSRDLFGMKQLYYAQTPQGFIFASELQAILETGLVRRDVDPEVRTELLQLRYSTGQKTIFGGIQRLLPGETLVIRQGEIIHRHQEKKKSQMSAVTSFEPALDLYEQTFQNSVQVHLRSDVPYGLFLSGGLDSGSLLAFMRRETSQKLRTYTIGFENKSVQDERGQAAKLSQHFQTDHTEINFSEQDFWSLLPQVIAAHDDPIFDQAMVPTFKLASVAAPDVKVILSGEGGDEMLAGYRRYQKVSWPTWLGGRLSRRHGSFRGTPMAPLLEPWRQNLDQLQSDALSRTSTKVQAAQMIDLESWLPNNLLLKLDRCLMHHGIEGRTPYLDRMIFDQLFTLPDTLKIRRGQGKWVLRQWLARHLPLAEPFAKKKGFNVPVEAWIRGKANRLGTLVARQPGIEEFLRPEHVLEVFKNDKYGNVPWMLLSYALWHQRHVCNLPVVNDTLATLSLR